MTNTSHIQLLARTSDKVWNDTLSRIPDSPRCAALAEFRLTTGHDCLPHHLHRFGITPSPICPLCDLPVVLDKNHLLHCPALLTKTLISRYWEARGKINNRWLYCYVSAIWINKHTPYAVLEYWILIQELRCLLKLIVTLTVIAGVICWISSRNAVFSSTRLCGWCLFTSPFK